MAGPYTGSWRASVTSQAEYTGALKWGTGVNPIHSVYGAGINLRQRPNALVYDPVTTPGGDDTFGYVAEDQGWYFNSDNPDPNLPQYDVNDPTLWGYGSQTGTKDRPEWGNELGDRSSNEMGWGLPNPDTDTHPLPDVRNSTQNDTGDRYPSWGHGHSPGWPNTIGGNVPTRPKGQWIRQRTRGNLVATQKMKVLPNEDVAQGWENKAHGIAADSRPADDSQVFMQTSDVQRYKTRSGSQRSGSQSTFEAPIDSRVTGQKVKVYASSESARHWDMLPYEQEDFARPFLSRQAGTGYPQWMLVNEQYISPAIQREPPADPQLGSVAGYDGNTTQSDYGYTAEDLYY
jgi:hypothetical protein